MSRKVTDAMKKIIAGKQFYKCANKPGSNINGIRHYSCPLWKNIEHAGSFDENGLPALAGQK